MSSAERRQYAWLKAAVGMFVVTLMTGAVMLGISSAQQFNQRGIDCGCGLMQMPEQAPLWPAIGGLAASAGTVLSLLGALGYRLYAARRDVRLLTNVPQRIVVHAPTNEPIIILQTAAARAFTAGSFRPRVYVSDGLIAQLTKSELEAVIRHEQFHRRAFDPLVGVVLETVRTAFGWMPWIRTWVAAAYTYRELAADAAATHSYVRTGGLSGAILKLATSGAPGAFAAFSPNTDRVDRLLDDAWQPAIRPWRASLVVPALLVLLGVMWLGRHTAAAAAPQPTPACRETRIMCSSVRVTPGPTMTYVIPISLPR